MKQCFVGFFGLNRSLKWTYPSIHAHVLEPLREAGFDLHLAGHFNCPDTIVNPWSRENGIPLDMSQVHRLGLQMQWQEHQDDASIETLLPHVLAVPYRGLRDTGGKLRRNVLHQFYSLRQLWRMLTLMDVGRFDMYCLLRPDLEYLEPVPVVQITRDLAAGSDVITPDWERWGGLNDRFAFCSRRGAEEYMLRIRHVAHFCESRSYFHSEEFLDYVIRQAGLSTSFIATKARRVRATGVAQPEDFRRGGGWRSWLHWAKVRAMHPRRPQGHRARRITPVERS